VTLLFDRIILSEGDEPRELTLDEFLRLPLHFRVQMILQNRLTFSRAGQSVPTREALGQMRLLLADTKKS
jgi:hypothetical protein